ncbi:class I SAM-dependent methyltransferase [Candidatus Cyanaurora vandensis]|uniref:class I SAM-dependent methyltransferase n=1 Tax=Candidatus Cyanaurora vandensis TaxID=2714958 RepID=UPI002579896D|nr:class I SAM-dependent methyltransferase [Candidatus Cyanaurora vandensis]
MALPRIPEPEVMDEALAYAAMDHGGVNRQFVQDLALAEPRLGRWLDVGTGPAQIPILVCEHFPTVQLVAVDAAPAMLLVAQKQVQAARLSERIELVQADAKHLPWSSKSFTTIFTNSLLHHLPDPRPCLQELKRLLAPGGLIFLRDLIRPRNAVMLQQLISVHTAQDSNEQRKLFADSLWASFTLDEVQQLAAWVGLTPVQLSQTSDRHWTLIYRNAQDG